MYFSHNYITKLVKKQAVSKSTSKIFSLLGYRKWLVAAGIVLLVGAFIFQNKRPIYSDYASHNRMEIKVRGNSNETLEKIQNAFNAKDYALANVHLSRLAEYYKDNTELQLYYAITLIETDQYEMAKMLLKQISKTNNLYKDDAYWYLALLALKQKDYDTCSSNLEKISKKSSIYGKAKKLAKTL